MPNASPGHLLNTSWSAYRLSPLHHDGEPTFLNDPDALKKYAKRLYNTLAGQVLRGLQLSNSTLTTPGDALARAGTLVGCRWDVIPTWSFARDHPDLDEEDDVHSMNDIMGILIRIEYENVIYKAALLTSAVGYNENRRRASSISSTHLPLLLTRMPNALRDSLVQFLSTNFDAYCSQLRLPSAFLCATLEKYVSSVLAAAGTNASHEAAMKREIVESVIKDMHVTLSFNPDISRSLRSGDLYLPRETVATFALESDVHSSSGFLGALARYLNQHLAMTVNLSRNITEAGRENDVIKHVWMSKASCSAFALSIDGRIKLAAIDGSASEQPIMAGRLTPEPNEMILETWVQRAAGVEDMPP
ncbi:hypothetical protein VTN31DRAFT_5690 [Thermomyces dupontii]|uniref:uncharacterized protein n=1 Tax=Talaromyces thermophilus TaxID=28565 RepID=UPI0037440AF7